MKKITIMMLAMYILSMLSVATLAHEHEDEHVEAESETEVKVGTGVVDARVRADARIAARANTLDRAQEARDNAKDRVDEARAAAKARLADVKARLEQRIKTVIEKRDIAKERIEEARKKQQEAMERREEARKNYDESKGEFERLRIRLAACEESDDNCAELRAEVETEAKTYLLSATERMIAKLKEAAASIEANEALTDEEVEEALDRLNRIIAELEALMEDIMAADTKEELQGAAEKLRRIWGAAEDHVKRHTLRSAGKRIGLVVHQAELLERRLACAIGSVDEPSEELLKMLEDFDMAVAEARMSFEAAKEAWEAGDHARAQVQIREGHEHLKKAHRISQEILKMIREEGGSFAGCVRDVLPPERSDIDRRSGNSEDSDGDGVEERTEARIDGNVDLSPRAEELLDLIVAKLAESEGRVKVKFHWERDDNQTRFESDVEGDLGGTEQMLRDFKAAVDAMFEDLRDGAELTVEIRHTFHDEDDLDESDDSGMDSESDMEESDEDHDESDEIEDEMNESDDTMVNETGNETEG